MNRGGSLQRAGSFRQMIHGDADIRSNLTAGAIARPAEITSAMLELAEAIRPRLERDGIFFAGIDVIGGRLMEVNVQSPGGLVEAEGFAGVPLCHAILEAIEAKLAWRCTHPDTDNCTLATLPAR